MKQKRNYQFYFYYQKYGEKHIVINKVCKAPTKTKVYKQLLNSLDKGFIHSFGYESTEIENNFIKV
jgi:hypothetical protein